MSDRASQLRRAVFLDRDGVINRCIPRNGQPGPPYTWDEFELLPGVNEALARLRQAGFLLIIVTNQPDVATGVQRPEDVEAIHQRLQQVLPVDDIRVCCHVDADQCTCRKPKPGMLLEAARQRSIDLAQSFLVGDRWRDIGAGRAAGCKTILVRGNPDQRQTVPPDWTVDSLLEAASWILNQTSETK